MIGIENKGQIKPSDLVEVVPREVMDKTSIICVSDKPVWVGLRIKEVLGDKAARAFALYRM